MSGIGTLRASCALLAAAGIGAFGNRMGPSVRTLPTAPDRGSLRGRLNGFPIEVRYERFDRTGVEGALDRAERRLGGKVAARSAVGKTGVLIGLSPSEIRRLRGPFLPPAASCPPPGGNLGKGRGTLLPAVSGAVALQGEGGVDLYSFEAPRGADWSGLAGSSPPADDGIPDHPLAIVPFRLETEEGGLLRMSEVPGSPEGGRRHYRSAFLSGGWSPGPRLGAGGDYFRKGGIGCFVLPAEAGRPGRTRVVTACFREGGKGER